MSSAPPSAAVSGSADAVVVGGGLAGLVAARELRRAGRSVILLEARLRLGGRTWFRPFPEAERSVELGGTWVSRRHQPLIAREMERYGLAVEATPAIETTQLWCLNRSFTQGLSLTVDEGYELEAALVRIGSAARRIDSSLPRDQQDLRDLDVSVDQFIRESASQERVRNLLYAYAALYSGADATEWSALQALSLFADRAYSVLAVYFVGNVFEVIAGGTKTLLDALELDAAADIHLDTPVVSIAQTDDEVSVVTSSGTCFRAAVAVVAVPLNILPTLDFTPSLPDDKRRGIGRGHRGRMQKVWMLVDQISQDVNATGWRTPFLRVTTVYACPAGKLLVGFSAPPAKLDVSNFHAVAEALEPVAPDARLLATASHDWSQDPFSRGTWMCYKPASLTVSHSALQQRVGRLVFAGSDLATRWIGHMEGAVESGLQGAAQAIELTARKRRRAAAGPG